MDTTNVPADTLARVRRLWEDGILQARRVQRYLPDKVPDSALAGLLGIAAYINHLLATANDGEQPTGAPMFKLNERDIQHIYDNMLNIARDVPSRMSRLRPDSWEHFWELVTILNSSERRATEAAKTKAAELARNFPDIFQDSADWLTVALVYANCGVPTGVRFPPLT